MFYHPPFSIPSKTVQEVHALRSRQHPVQLIDVREAYETVIYQITPCTHIPLANIEHELHQLDKEALTIVYCKRGIRSQYACEQLLHTGFNHVYNMDGGIIAWIDAYEPKSKRQHFVKN